LVGGRRRRPSPSTTIANHEIDIDQRDKIGAMKPTTRLATPNDIEEVVRLRRVLFDSLGEADTGWEHRCAAVLRKATSEGWMIVAVVDQPSGPGLAAVGTAEVQQRLPGPTNPSGLVGYIGTMATEPTFRRQGLASTILECLVAELRAREVQRIELHATPVAEALYRAAGFADRPGGIEMRLLDA
jgi:GNAT superfamily N-acetyltransferase